MRKLFINSKGQVILKDVRSPIIENEGTLVKTSYALISTGTELSMIKAKRMKSFPVYKKIIKSKDFRISILRKIKNLTLKDIFRLYFAHKNKDISKNFSNPIIKLGSLGYSCSGLVLESNIDEFKKNDRVACAGSSHGEIIYSPKNLTCKIPDNVSLKEASFTTLGAISIHGIHRANIKPGEYVGIIGAGLIGLLTIQIAKASGAHVVALDLINKRLNLANKLGADIIINPNYYNSKIKVDELTKGNGLDSIIICAASKTSKPLEEAIDLIRDKGTIVLVGDVPININRKKLYMKEADLLISRSYGPGRYDPYYEYEGYDYPINFVPFTEKRNMELFLKLISDKKIDVNNLISQIIPIENANLAYKKLEDDPINNISILLSFLDIKSSQETFTKKSDSKHLRKKLIIGLIGCGRFAQATHLPYLLENPNCEIKAICTEHKNTAEFCNEKFNPKYTTTNYKTILKDTEIDTVFIYTRHNTHAKFTIEALKFNKNVFSEKPMALTWENCVKIKDLVEKYQKNYMIGFNRRYSPFIKLTKELLEKRNNPIIMHYRIASNYRSGNDWLYDPKIGGGPLLGEFCHFIDLILYLANSTPIELIAKGGHLSHKNIETYDSCTVILKFQNGSVANLIYTDLSGPKMPKERIEIFSGESAIIIDDFIKMETIGFGFGNLQLKRQDKGHKNELTNVINTNLGIENPTTNVDIALKAMDLCFKTIESIKNNKLIKL